MPLDLILDAGLSFFPEKLHASAAKVPIIDGYQP